MRNTKERVAAVKRRSIDINLRKKVQRERIIAISFAAVCLLIITGVSFNMPGIINRLSNNSYISHSFTASIFEASGSLGYVVVAILSFTLGVCVTILSHRIHVRNQEQKKEQEKQERENNYGRAD